MQAYKRLLDAVNKAALWVALAATVVMSVMIILQVLFRYVIQSSLSFSEELARYAFIWAAFIGSAIALSKRAHISVDLIVAKLPRKPKKAAIVVTNSISSVFFVLMIVYGIVMLVRTIDQTSPAMGLRVSYVYLSVPIAGLIMLMNAIYNGWEEYLDPDIIKSEGVE